MAKYKQIGKVEFVYILDQLKRCVSLTDIARELHRRPCTIWWIKQDHFKPLYPLKRFDKMADQSPALSPKCLLSRDMFLYAVKAYQMGYSQQEIADRLDVNLKVVGNALRRYKVRKTTPIEPLGEWIAKHRKKGTMEE